MKVLSTKKYNELLQHEKVSWKARMLVSDVLYHWIFNPIACYLFKEDVALVDTINLIHKGYEDREGWAKKDNERLRKENERLRNENEHLRKAFNILNNPSDRALAAFVGVDYDKAMDEIKEGK